MEERAARGVHCRDSAIYPRYWQTLLEIIRHWNAACIPGSFQKNCPWKGCTQLLLQVFHQKQINAILLIGNLESANYARKRSFCTEH